jgi:CubicO group peptidase (beta-lactamase class C family)
MSPEEQRATNLGGRLFEENGFGFGVSVRSVSSRIGPSIGAYGWNGAGGTSWSADPEKDMVSFILFQLVDPSKIDRIWNDIRATIYGSMVE